MPHRESPPLLDDEDLLALVSLLRMPHGECPQRSSAFQRVLFNVCCHTRSRRTVLRMMLAMVRYAGGHGRVLRSSDLVLAERSLLRHDGDACLS